MIRKKAGNLYVGTIREGVFHSEDNGDTWSQIIAGLAAEDIFALALDSTGNIFAGSGGSGVFRSLQSVTSGSA